MMKLIQEKIANTVGHISIGNNFMNTTPIPQQLESINKWDCRKLKSFCIVKEMVTGLKRAYRMGEKNLC
jgi:hypothetical protein